MSSLAFVYLARNAGPTFEDLAHDIAGLTRPGDHVLVVEDGGGDDTPSRIGRFTEQVGWGADVAVTTILTGTAGPGDFGAAANLALDALAVPGAGRDRVVFACSGGRLDGAAFAAARAQVEAEDLDLLAFPLRQWSLDLGAVIDGPDLDAPAGASPLAHARALHPGLDGMILRGPLDLRCDEGWDNFGALGLWWQALAGAGRIGVAPRPLGHRAHPPEPTATLFTALGALIGRDASAAPWADDALPRLLAGLTPGAVTGLLAAGPELARAVGAAAADPLLQAFAAHDGPAARDRLLALRKTARTGSVSARSDPLSIPEVHAQPAPIRVCVTGRHSHRQPFAYPAFAPLWDGAVELTGEAGAAGAAGEADLIVIAHPHNLVDLRADLAEAAARGTPIALISEEPFWDTLFSPDPLAHVVTLGAAHLGTARVHQVTHHRSAIFDFHRIPYFLLTDPGYIDRYAALFARNAARSADDWAEAFAHRPDDVTFMAERRLEAFHDVTFPGGDIVGLCAWRTRLAMGCTIGRVQRLGASWGQGQSRFDLTDWHGDKLARLDGRTRILSGIENTHQPTYLSEKLFDAFACGALPLYYASPGHRLHDMGLPGAAWLNLWGQDSAAAVDSVQGVTWDGAMFEAYVTAQRRLAALFTDADILAAERARLGRALVAEVARLVSYGPP